MSNETPKNQIFTRKQAAFDHLAQKRLLWDKVEQLFHGQLNDQISLESGSNVFDPKLGNLNLERGYRVMSQLPTGKVKPISKNDIGASQLMNLTLDKYVIPNANAQFDFLTKMRMVDIYSNLYGCFFTLTDWDVKPNGYVGPDVWLLNIRDVFHQVGAMSLEDSDYVIVRTWRPLSFFEGLLKDKAYKNIPEIIEKLKDKVGSKQARDTENMSARENRQYPTSSPAKGSGFFEILTQYEKDKWTDYCVDADMEFRDIKNDTGELPVDCKYSIPLMDDFMAMGDFERGGSMQQVVNSNWSLYLRAVKMSIFPPMMINENAVSSDSSIRYIPAAKWLFKTGQSPVTGAASTIAVSPQGIQTFNNTQQVANASILGVFGTSDTAVTQQTDPGYGKTPQALKMQAARENVRDNADRFYMEQYLKKVMKKMVNLISKKQSTAISVRLFEEEIDEIERSYPEVREMYDDKTGKLTIKKGKTGSILYDYELVSGSTFALDQKMQQENLSMLVDMYLKSQRPDGSNSLVMDLDRDGYVLKFGEMFKRIVASSGIQDWDKILIEKTPEEKNQDILQQNSNMFMQAVQGMGNMNQVPPQPTEETQGLSNVQF